MEGKPPAQRSRRWPGLLLSLFVPGFGLIRAGLWGRGVGWFIGMLLFNFLVAVSLALSFVPVWLAVVIVLTSVAAPICMLRDGFRPGKMTRQRWLLFLGMFVAIMVIPSPVLSVVRTFRIPTGGMEPTLRGERSSSGADHVIVDLLSYRFSSPKRGDIIVFSTSRITALHKITGDTGENFFMQRLVGMPGEVIRIADGKVFANGKPLGEADGIPPFHYQYPHSGFMQTSMKQGEDFVIGPDEYFVLGDNTSNSLDSRYWGCVPRSSVIGKVTMIYYPFTRAGRLPAR